MKLITDLAMVPINTPDAEFRIQSAWRILAVMVLEGVGRDSELAPVVLPQESLGQPSQIEHSTILDL